MHCGLALLQEGQRLGERVLHEHGQAGCHVRVGIHTGPVLLGGGVDEEGTIRGLTVNVAARMEQTAPVGTLRISQDTWLQVRGSFACESQPPLQVKGRDEPILTYLVQRALPRAERVVARGIDGVATPLVGRDAELAQLLAARDAVLAQRAPQALTLLGEPGLGKSRLLAELQAGLAEPRGARWWLLRGRTHPQTRLQPYGLLRDLLHTRLQIADSDSADSARAKLEEGLAPWLGEGDGDAAQAQAHRLGQLLGMDFAASPWVQGQTPQQLRQAGFAALLAYLAALARDGSAVALLIEDLHWADDGSLDFITELGAQQQPLLLVASTRPELLQRRPDWGQALPQHRQLVLQALPPATGQVLAEALLQRLQGDPQFGSVRALLLQHAGGNPFYMEELVRMLRDDGVVQQIDAGTPGAAATWRLGPRPLALARLPTTLVGVLQARLDALPAADRQALQQASIVGPVFWDEALAALDPAAPQAIPTLRGRALVRQQAQSAFEGTTEEAFAHHLLQQVTYDTVLKTARRAGHAAAAQWLADRVGERASEYLALIAEHYERAGDHERAFDYLLRAAEAAAERYANDTALEYTARALASPVAQAEPRRRVAVLRRRGMTLDVMGRRDEQQATLAEREALVRELGDDALLADVLFAQALLASRRADDEGSLVLAKEAAAVADRCGHAGVGALARAQIAWVHHVRADSRTALHYARSALELLRSIPPDPADDGTRLSDEVKLLTVLAAIERSAGQPGPARQHLLEALPLAQRSGGLRVQIHLHEYLGALEQDVGEYEVALLHFGQALELAQVVGMPTAIGYSNMEIANNLLQLGRVQAAAPHLAQALALAERHQDRKNRGRALMLQGVAATLGGEGDARALLQQAQAGFSAAGLRLYATKATALLARWHLQCGEIELATQCSQLIDDELCNHPGFAEGTDPLLPRFACAQVWAANGDPRAAAMLAQAHGDLQRMASCFDDGPVRQAVLQQVPLHREIIAAWQAAQAAPASGSALP